MQLQGRVAAVTGGTAGIGRAIAEAFLREGARVAIMARNADRATAMLEEIGAGERLVFVRGDAVVRADVEGFVDSTVEMLGSIDILVNNAGGAGDLKRTVELSDEAFDLCMKWNVYSTFWATRRALRTMLQRRWGRIINISSIAGKHGRPVVTAYTTAKHAIIGMTKSIAREVGEEGITVNAICPGIVITELVSETGPETAAAMGITLEEFVGLYTSDSATKRPNTVEEVAAVAVLLASDAGAGITGTQISVDGGTAQY